MSVPILDELSTIQTMTESVVETMDTIRNATQQLQQILFKFDLDIFTTQVEDATERDLLTMIQVLEAEFARRGETYDETHKGAVLDDVSFRIHGAHMALMELWHGDNEEAHNDKEE